MCVCTTTKCLLKLGRFISVAVAVVGQQGAVVALERGEAAGERSLQLGGEEHAQLRDDASGDELVGSDVKRGVPHIDT